MKTLIALTIGIAFAAGTVGMAIAQTTTPAAPPAEKKSDTKMEKMEKSDMKAKKPAAKTANGMVKSAGADSIVVSGKEKGKEAEWTFAVDPKTKITKAGKSIAAADVKAGDAVTVRYMEQDGKTMAQSVNVKPGKSAKATKDATAKETAPKK